jgi:hypothetical protein
MSIFRQNRHFSNVLVVWKTEVEVLTVCGASCKTDGNLKGLTVIFP